MSTFHIDPSLARAIHARECLDSRKTSFTSFMKEEMSADWLAQRFTYFWWERDNVAHDAFHCGVKVSWSSVQGLEGLEHASNLGTLVLPDHRVSSLEPLRHLPITELDLAHGPLLTDIGPLATCKKLHTLTISHTGVQDLSPLAGHPSLRQLNAEHLTLDDASIDVLARMKSEGVVLHLDVDTITRVDEALSAQLKASASGVDEVLDTLLSFDLSMAAQLWQQDPFGQDTARNSVIHLIMKAPLDRFGQEGRARRRELCAAILASAPAPATLLLPNLEKQMPLVLAIEEADPDLEAIAMLAAHTTQWEPSGCKVSAMGRALELRSYRSADVATFDAILAILAQYDEALIVPTAFAALCAHGSVEEVERAIHLGADPDPILGSYLPLGATPLQHAVEKDRVDVARCLLQAGARPNIGSMSGTYYNLALHHANSIAMIDLLLAHGADIHRANYFGQYVTSTAPSRMYRAIDDARIALLDHLLEQGAPCPTHQRTMLETAAKSPAYKAHLELVLASHGKLLDVNSLDARSRVRLDELKGPRDSFGLKAAKLPTHFKQLIKLVEKHGINLEQCDQKPGWRAAIKLLRYLNNRSFKGVEPWTWLRPRVDSVLEEHLTAREERDPVSALLRRDVPDSDNKRMAAMLWLIGPDATDDIGRSALDYIVLGHEDSYSTDFVSGLRPHIDAAVKMLEHGARARVDHEGNHTLSHAISGVLVHLPDDTLLEALGSQQLPVLTLGELFKTWDHSSKHLSKEEVCAWRQKHAQALFEHLPTDTPFPYLIPEAFRHMTPESLRALFPKFELTPDTTTLARASRMASRVLPIAATRGDLSLVEALLDLGANPESDDAVDQTTWPLANASTPELARRLLEAGANPHALRMSYSSPISLSSQLTAQLAHTPQLDTIAILHLLVEQGVSFDIANGRGSTAREELTRLAEEQPDDVLATALRELVARL